MYSDVVIVIELGSSQMLVYVINCVFVAFGPHESVTARSRVCDVLEVLSMSIELCRCDLLYERFLDLEIF